MCTKLRFSISSRSDDIVAEVRGATLCPPPAAGRLRGGPAAAGLNSRPHADTCIVHNAVVKAPKHSSPLRARVACSPSAVVSAHLSDLHLLQAAHLSDLHLLQAVLQLLHLPPVEGDLLLVLLVAPLGLRHPPLEVLHLLRLLADQKLADTAGSDTARYM